MIEEPLHRTFGVPLSEWVAKTPAELDIDAVGLWQIVANGREGFGLADEELVSFVAACVAGCLEEGALPVTGSPDGWIARQDLSGLPKAELVQAVIDEWLRAGSDPRLGDPSPWFARPDIIGKA